MQNMIHSVSASFILIVLIFAPLVTVSRGNRRIRNQSDQL
jgi:hypothetical protein